MQRAVTAIYRTHATATLVRDELEGLGIPRHDIAIVPDIDTGTTGGAAGNTATGGYGTDGGPAASGTGMGTASGTGVPATGSTSGRTADDHAQHIHDLHLPEDDTRTYQQAVRNGDYVLCASVDDEAHLDRVQEIMRRPEDAYNLAELDNAYATAPYEPRRSEADETYRPGAVGRRDDREGHPSTRSYSRDEALTRRGPLI